MNKVSLAVSCCLLAGCSNFAERHQASGDFEYLKVKPGKALEVPGELKPIEGQKEFEIPPLTVNNANVNMGRTLDIRSPLLPLALAKDTRVIDKARRAEILFESLMSADQMKQALWQQLQGFLSERHYPVASQTEFTALETGWLDSQAEFKSLYGLEEEVSLRQKFRFELSVAQQGYSATLLVKLIDHQQSNGDAPLENSATRRYETQMLNMLMSYLHKIERIEAQETVKKANRGMQLELGFDDSGHSAYVVKAPFEQAWAKMDQILPRLGFVVDDRDKTLGTYFVRFEGVESGFWSSLWGRDAVAEIALDKGKYQLKVLGKDDRATLGFTNEAGEQLSPAQMTQMYNAFKSVMAKDLL